MGLFDIFKKNKKIDVQILEQQMDQKIFNILQNYLPNNWLEVVFFVGYYKDDSGYFKYWVKTEKGQYVDCFTLIPEPKQGEKDILQEQLMKLHKEMKWVRGKLSEKHKWICMVMSISNQGKLTKTYDYADGVVKQNLMQYVEDYKNKLNEKYCKE